MGGHEFLRVASLNKQTALLVSGREKFEYIALVRYENCTALVEGESRRVDMQYSVRERFLFKMNIFINSRETLVQERILRERAVFAN